MQSKTHDSKLVVHGALLKCSEGTLPSKLAVLPQLAAGGAKERVVILVPTPIGEAAAATIKDHQPLVNVMPFGMCQTVKNPQVAAATTAAQGVLTPQPCVPIVSEPWSPGTSIALLDGEKILTNNSTCMCAWAGTIEVSDPGSDIDMY